MKRIEKLYEILKNKREKESIFELVNAYCPSRFDIDTNLDCDGNITCFKCWMAEIGEEKENA